MHMKSKRGPGRPKKKRDVAASEDGADGGSRTGARGKGGVTGPTGDRGDPGVKATGADPGVKAAGADRGGQPEGVEADDEQTVHNGSAGAFEATEEGHYEEDSDEDNDDFALEH